MTINQIIRHGRKNKKRKNKAAALDGCPQKSGVCLKVSKHTPKKPNSAQRSVAKVKLSNKKVINAYIPGEKHKLQEHSYVLIKYRNKKDLPGVKYIVVKGALDDSGVEGRKNRVSVFGTKRS